jgi:transcription initiation factor TFIID TATA-box-binding protein
LIFRSGKVVVTGAKSEDSAESAAKNYSKIIKKVLNGKQIKMLEFKVHNVVASFDFGFPVSLENMN